jgi:hypothetical protein
LSVGALALFVLACFSSIIFNRIACMKAKEEAIATDFLLHYSEMVKALPFSNVAGGFPINPLYNGTGGSPNVVIPANSTAIALNTTNFEAFHPDLIWLHNRNPQLQVTLTTTSVSGVQHDKHLNIKLIWDPPLGRGGRQQSQLDLLRTVDL